MKKIVFASDFAPIRHFSQLLKDDPASVYGDMGEVLRRADCGVMSLLFYYICLLAELVQ